jgi:enolase-phosphatase E1
VIGRVDGLEAVLLDVEGTTTPIAFVTGVLFPYARSHVASWLEQHIGSRECESLCERLRADHLLSAQRGEAVPAWRPHPDSSRIASVAAYVEWQMDHDRKSTPLKELQGLIWAEGYRRGELVGALFPDVPEALRRWRRHDKQVAIFSSGSVLAQQLLFRYSSAGDLTALIDAFFDTNTGSKIEPDSYRRIASSLRVPVHAVLFASDVDRELDAARTAGLMVRAAVRPGNAPLNDIAGYQALVSFDEI